MMPRKRRGSRVGRVIIVLVLALLAEACWLYEVLAMRGWDGLAWLYPFPLAAIPGCLLVALASWTPLWGQELASRWKLGLYLLLAWGLALGSFPGLVHPRA
jgi:hypothetical protein